MRPGELYLVDFGQTSRGFEQANVRPAMVVHSGGFRVPNLAIVCPITRAERGVPNHVGIAASAESGLLHASYVMTEQIRAVDRRFVAARLGMAPTETTDAVLRILRWRILAAPRTEN
jgi:mRNA-degrading endonuclease toxin of MazEF toxin-antitoxin module